MGAQVVAMVKVQPVLAAAPEKLRAAAYMHFRLAELGQQYASMRQQANSKQ